MEHAVSADIHQRLVEFLEFMDYCPHTDVKWHEPWGFMCGNCEPEVDATDCEVESCKFREAFLDGKLGVSSNSEDS
jgi:Mn-dependent DtxR family transcriptional regulator